MKSRWLSVFVAFMLILWGSGVLFTACSENESVKEEEEGGVLVRVMFNPNGLGDLSYNDDILRGILAKQKELNFRLQYTCPEDEEEEIHLIRKWQQEPEGQYVILAGDQLKAPARELAPSATSQNYLLCDMDLPEATSPIFRFCGYGVSFLAGVAARVVTQSDSAVYIGGKTNDNYLEDAYYGFRDGFLHAGGKKVPEIYISTDGAGFRNPARGYELADSLFRLYPFICAMAGGTNSGIYKYLRENPDLDVYTVGVDKDQSIYSDRIVGSMIKDVGGCAGSYIEWWMNGEEIPMWQYFDLRSDFMHFKISVPYAGQLESVLSENLQTAIEREKEYEEKYRRVDE